MNSIFNYSRFRLLLGKYFSDSWPRLRFMGLMLLAICILTALIGAYNRPWCPMTGLSFMGLISVIIGLKVMSISFSGLSHRVTCVMELTTPGSALEKLAARWCVSFPLWIVWTFVCINIAGLFHMLMRYILNGHVNFVNWAWILTNSDTYLWLLVYMALHSFYMLGSLVWRKLHFQKTTLALLILGFIYVAAFVTMSFLFFSASPKMFPSAFTIMSTIVPLCVAVTVVNYVISWFRLREAQVINHW